jgi:aconitate hydratase
VWDGNDLSDLPVLLKAKGKCTTDHISPAGVEWLRFRGHLDNISDNMFSRVSNSFTGAIGTGVNLLTGESKSLSQVARDYKALGLGWVVIGDSNYGEGSSREHAAMSPRYLGGRAVIARSFARIHRSNLWKQGMLALTFVQPDDYDKIQAGDRLSLAGLKNLAPEQNVIATITHADGTSEAVELSHGMGRDQINWFVQGSFLNFVRAKHEQAGAPSCCSSEVAGAAEQGSAMATTIEPSAATAPSDSSADAAGGASDNPGFVARLKTWIVRILSGFGWK